MHLHTAFKTKYLFAFIFMLFIILLPTRPVCAVSSSVCGSESGETELMALSDDTYSDALLSFDSKNDIDLDVPEGWELYRTLAPSVSTVTVAVIDTGIDFMHEDLKARLWTNPGEIPDNGIDDDGNGYVDDIYGWNFCDDSGNICEYPSEEDSDTVPNPFLKDNHGTHVAGIIAAEADNDAGIAGIASCGDVRIMVLKVHDGENLGNVEKAAEAVRYAEAMGASVCNISWGTYSNNSSLFKAISDSSMLFCAAAGNEGEDNDLLSVFPGCYDLPNVISVTYTDNDGKLTSLSNYGKLSVDCAVPATDVYSTTVGGYGYMSGSSMAVPHVSGIAALLFSLDESYTAAEVRSIILDSLKPLDTLDGFTIRGGIPSLYNALLYSQGLYENTEPVDTVPPEIFTSKKFTPEGIEITVEVTDEGGSGVDSVKYLYGKQEAETFKGGFGGMLLDHGKALIQKGGKYTFYAIDAAGNETVKTILVTEDTLAPTFKNTAFSVSSDYSYFTVTGSVSDKQSGLKSLKYLKGLHSADDFSKNKNTAVEVIDDSFSFKVSESGIYTLLARDNAGNKSIFTIRCYIRRAQSVNIVRKKKTIGIGEKITLRPEVTPVGSTDSLTYKSSNKKVCKVSKSGIITGIGEGTATVTVKTSSGCSDTIKITVINRSSLPQ